MKPAHKKRMASLLPHNHSEHLSSMRKKSLRFCQKTKRTLYKCSAKCLLYNCVAISIISYNLRMIENKPFEF